MSLSRPRLFPFHMFSTSCRLTGRSRQFGADLLFIFSFCCLCVLRGTSRRGAARRSRPTASSTRTTRSSSTLLTALRIRSLGFFLLLFLVSTFPSAVMADGGGQGCAANFAPPSFIANAFDNEDDPSPVIRFKQPPNPSPAHPSEAEEGDNETMPLSSSF